MFKRFSRYRKCYKWGRCPVTYVYSSYCSPISAKNGVEPILQFTTRDRNKSAIQGALIVDRIIKTIDVNSLIG